MNAPYLAAKRRDNVTLPLTLTCGAAAAEHLEPYSDDASSAFELARHFGRMIAAWDKPEFVSAAAASHMRDNDYVVGLVHRGVARAYPLWITDNYHVVNDRIGGDPVVFATCERCQSGAAFISMLGGERVKFNGTGMYNASMTMVNRGPTSEHAVSHWLHYEGVALNGTWAGTLLPQIPTFHTTWREWRATHPDTDVMLPPLDRHHRDARHGHGREEYFSRPGMDLPLVATITGPLDDRYPENEMVLGVNMDQGVKAYPLREVQKSGGVVADDLAGHPIVVFAGPRPEQFTMAAYSCVAAGQVLSFRREGDHFLDAETESRWTIEGAAVRGPLAGTRLTPLRGHYVRWHAWFYPHRSTELYRHEAPLPLYPAAPAGVDIAPFAPVLDGIAKLGRRVAVEGATIELRLPHEACHGLCLHAGTDRLNLYGFASEEAAEDYVALNGGWFCMPVGARLERKAARRAGRFVLESDPERQFADPTQAVPLPAAAIGWSDLVTNERLVRLWRAEVSDAGVSADGEPARGFAALAAHLRQSGYDVIEVAFLPHSQLRVGTVSAVAATVNADRVAIYKCESEAAAQRVVADLTHAIHVGRFVVRSIPIDMYQDQHYEIGQMADEEIRWSKLLDNRRFLTSLQSFVAASGKAPAC